MPIPGTDTHGSVSYIHGAVIPKASENQELAIKFIKDKLLQEQFQTDSMNSYGKMSPMKAHYEKLDNPYWPTVLDFTEKSNDASSVQGLHKAGYQHADRASEDALRRFHG